MNTNEAVETIAELLRVHVAQARAEERERCAQLMDEVGATYRVAWGAPGFHADNQRDAGDLIRNQGRAGDKAGNKGEDQ